MDYLLVDVEMNSIQLSFCYFAYYRCNLDDATSLIKLSKIDPLSNVNQKQASDVDIGLGAREVIVEGRSKGLISPTELLAFKKECRAFLATVCQHIMEKIPLKSKFARNASCINSKMMATDSDPRIKKYSVILEMLMQSKRISTKDADELKIQFQQLLCNNMKEKEISFL